MGLFRTEKSLKRTARIFHTIGQFNMQAGQQRSHTDSRLLYCYRAETAIGHGDHTGASPIKVQGRQLNPFVRIWVVLLHSLQILYAVVSTDRYQSIAQQSHSNCISANAQIRNLK